MVVVYQNYGSVISIMIVVTIQTNLLTCVDSAIARLAGRDVLEERIIDVYLSGCFVMAKTIVATVLMNYLKIVRNVSQPETFNARTIGVYRRDGYVTLKMTVVTTRMSLKTYVKGYIGNVQNPNSSVPMANVYQANGDVTMMTIVAIIQMNSTVEDSSVKMVLSNVRADIALRLTSVVMEIEIVETSVTKLVVLQDIQVADIVQHLNLSAKPPNCVYLILNFVMVKMIVVTALMNHQTFVVSLIEIYFDYF